MDINKLFNDFNDSGLDSEEKSKLEAWKQESLENVQMLQELQQIHDADLSDYIEVDTDSAWAAMQDKTEVSQTSVEPVQTLQKPNYFLRIAAVLAVVAACLIGMKFFTSQEATLWEPKAYTSEISKKNVVLDDESTVVMDKKSSLSVLSEREVSVDGKAYFDIERNESIPFQVHTRHGNVTVLGTEFSVVTKETFTEVFVTEGKVKFSNDDRDIVLEVGDFIHVENGGITKTKKKDDNYLSWKDDRMVFRNTPLSVVIDDIERHYGKKIILKDPKSSARCHLTSTFENASFKTVLTELKTVFGLKLKRNGDIIEIVDSNC